MKRSFDWLAAPYRWLEYAAFGRRLQQTRVHCLPWTKDARRALLVGDGDGRFSAALLQSNPMVVIDSLDISPVMLATAVARAGAHRDRLHPICGDALTSEYPNGHYDLICLHFCLDCFTDNQVADLLPRLFASLAPNGIIAYSDFQCSRALHRWIVNGLFAFFRAIAGISARRLPVVRWPEEIPLVVRKEFLGGLVFTEIRMKSAEV